MPIADHVHHTRGVYANHQRLIDLQQEYETAADPASRAAIAEQAAFIIEHQIDHLTASRLARALTSLSLSSLVLARVDWLSLGERAWAEAAADPKEQ